MCDSAFEEITERKLVRAYTRLFLVPRGKDGTRSISLARFGKYDVFLVELAQDKRAPQFWMELYAHDVERGLDSCACEDLEQAAIAAQGLISQAKQLYEASVACRGSCH